MTKALIIDDEHGAATRLKIAMEKNFRDQFQLETALGGEEGIQKILSYKPDLIFLDIEMPMMNGFDLLTTIPQIDFKVIFTSAYDQYALRAIRHNALDYLLKPIDTTELVGAITKFRSQEVKREEIHQKVSKEQRIAIPTRAGMVFLDLDNIIRCEAELNYTCFCLRDNQNFISSKTLMEYEEILASHDKFIRIHRSHIVNTDYIIKYENGYLLLKDNTLIPVSRRRRGEVRKKIKETR